MLAGSMASFALLYPQGKQPPLAAPPLQPLPACILKLLLLLLLIAASLMPALAHSHHSRAWDRELPDTKMPKSVRDRVFHGHKYAEMSLRYYHDIKNGTFSSHSTRFCRDFRLACHPNVLVPSLELDSQDGPNLVQLFQESDILVGEQIMVPDLGTDYPFRAFLPALLARKLPFSIESLPDLLEMLNIPEDSRLANYMNETLYDCEPQKPEGATQVKHCVRTVEKMVHLIVGYLGHDVEVLQTKWSSEAKNKAMTVVEMASKGSHKSKRSVLCSEEMFPYSVYNCNEVKNIQNIEVKMESEDGKQVTAVMQCYSQHRKGFRVFAAMELVPNLRKKMCHWLTEKEIVFVKRDEMEKKKKKKKHHFWRVLLP